MVSPPFVRVRVRAYDLGGSGPKVESTDTRPASRVWAPAGRKVQTTAPLWPLFQVEPRRFTSNPSAVLLSSQPELLHDVRLTSSGFRADVPILRALSSSYTAHCRILEPTRSSASIWRFPPFSGYRYRSCRGRWVLYELYKQGSVDVGVFSLSRVVKIFDTTQQHPRNIDVEADFFGTLKTARKATWRNQSRGVERRGF